MSETKWTPGPWVHVHGTVYPADFGSVARGVLAVASVKLRPRARQMSLQEIATGDLIAAAPGLYEALRRVLDSYDGSGQRYVGSDEIRAARSALAKARGETP